MIPWIVFAFLFVLYGVSVQVIAPAGYKQGPKDRSFWLSFAFIHSIWITAAVQCRVAPTEFPVEIRIVAVLLVLAGNALSLTAMSVNPSFSRVIVRPDRIITNGVYRLRHPGYAGMACAALGYFLLLGQDWAVFPTGLYLGFLVARTHLENKLLYR